MNDVELDWNGDDLDIYIDGWFLGSIDINNISDEARQRLEDRKEQL